MAKVIIRESVRSADSEVEWEIDVRNCQPEVCMMLVRVSGAADLH